MLRHIKFSTPPAIFPWRPAAWLRITGEDAAVFLQGQFTNDLRPLTHAGAPAIYGLWLTIKGKVLADGFVARGANAHEFWIGSYFSPAGVIRERLESYVIADDVTVEDVTAEWAGVTLIGAGVGELVDAGAAEGGWVFPGRRQRGEHVECVYRAADGLPAWVDELGGRIVGEETMLRQRINDGIPAIPFDIGPADLPNEAGLESDAISFTKGCYLGQEVMARLKAMGQVRRRLVRVDGRGESLPVTPGSVFAGDRAVGELRSVVRDGAGGWKGLAMLARLHVAAGDQLALTAGGVPAMRVGDAP